MSVEVALVGRAYKETVCLNSSSGSFWTVINTQIQHPIILYELTSAGKKTLSVLVRPKSEFTQNLTHTYPT